jgi:hypothetical protein
MAKDYVAYCLICDEQMSLDEIRDHHEYKCLDEYGNLTKGRVRQ